MNYQTKTKTMKNSKTKEAILGKFTAQGIKQLIDSGQRIIKLEYQFCEVPYDVYDSSLQYTLGPRVAWDSDEELDETKLLEDFKDSVKRDLEGWLDEEDQITFYFELRESV